MKWLILIPTLAFATAQAQIGRAPFYVSGAAASAPATQALRPNGDVATDGWTSTGATYYTEIDEVTANNSDYIAGVSESAGEYVCTLSAGTNPGVTTGHILHVRILNSIAAITACYLSDATNGSLSDLTGFLSVGDNSITITDAVNITDYTTLGFGIAYDTGGDPGVTVPTVTQVWLEIPEASTPAIAFDDSASTAHQGALTTPWELSATLPINTSSNGYTLAGIAAYTETGDVYPDSVYCSTHTGEKFDSLGAFADANHVIIEFFGRKALATGNHVIKAKWHANMSAATDQILMVTSWNNVNQTTPTGAFTHNNSNGGDPSSITGTTLTGQIGVDILVWDASASATAVAMSPPTRRIQAIVSGRTGGAMGSNANVGSITSQWDFTGSTLFVSGMIILKGL